MLFGLRMLGDMSYCIYCPGPWPSSSADVTQVYKWKLTPGLCIDEEYSRSCEIYESRTPDISILYHELHNLIEHYLSFQQDSNTKPLVLDANTLTKAIEHFKTA